MCSRGDALALTAARAGVGGTVVIRSVLVVGCTAVSVLTAVLVGEAVLQCVLGKVHERVNQFVRPSSWEGA